MENRQLGENITMEIQRNEMLKKIETASEGFPLSKWFLKNETLPSGLNLKDYVEVQRFPRAIWNHFKVKNFPKAPRFEDYIKEDIANHLGEVYIDEQKVRTIGDLLSCFTESRRNLVQIFSAGEFSKGPRLEDIIMIDKMFRNGLLDGNLQVRELRNKDTLSYMQDNRSTQSLDNILHDLSSFSYALPTDKKTEDFLVNVPGNHALRTLGDTEDFLRERKDKTGRRVYRSFKEKFLTYTVPEFHEKFDWLCSQLFKEQRAGGGMLNPEGSRKSLSEIGMSNAIINIDNDPSSTFFVLVDTLKNSVGGDVSSIYTWMKRRKEI